MRRGRSSKRRAGARLDSTRFDSMRKRLEKGGGEEAKHATNTSRAGPKFYRVNRARASRSSSPMVQRLSSRPDQELAGRRANGGMETCLVVVAFWTLLHIERTCRNSKVSTGRVRLRCSLGLHGGGSRRPRQAKVTGLPLGTASP